MRRFLGLGLLLLAGAVGQDKPCDVTPAKPAKHKNVKNQGKFWKECVPYAIDVKTSTNSFLCTNRDHKRYIISVTPFGNRTLHTDGEAE